MSCILTYDSKIELLKESGILDKDMNVRKNSRDEIRRMEKSLQDTFRDNYGIETEEKIGSYKNGVLIENNFFREKEEELRKRGRNRYSGVIEEDFFDRNGKPLDINSNDLKSHLLQDFREIEGVVLNTKAITAEAVTNKGLQNLIEDLKNNRNIDIIAAVFPTKLLNTISTDIAGAREIDRRVKEQLQKGDSTTDILEDAVFAHKHKSVSEMNTLLDIALTNLNIKYTTTMSSDVGMSITGNMSPGNININPMSVGSWGKTYEESMSTLAEAYIHEKAHMLTIGLLNSDKEYRDKMTSLYKKADNYFKKHGMYEEVDGKPVKMYGMTNLHEFIAEGLSNDSFQRKLSDIKGEERSVFDELIDNIIDILNDVLNVDIRGTVLADLLIETNAATTRATKMKKSLYNINLDAYKILSYMDYSGKVTLPEGVYVSDIYKWAKENHLYYDAEKGKFLAGLHRKIALSKDALSYHLDYDKAKHSYIMDYTTPEGDTYATYEAYLEAEGIEDTSFLEPRTPIIKDLKERIGGDMEKLIKEQKSVVSPADSIKGRYYSVDSLEHYRSTSYLGSNVDGTKMIIKNAIRIGNIADELSKRVFSEEAMTVTFDEVSEVVKRETIGRYAKGDETDLEDIPIRRSQNEIDIFTAEYQEPVSREGFETLKTAMYEAKESIRIMDPSNKVVKFHADIVVWDFDTRVAGEVDILAEHEDGSLTVIDMKTRRKGVEGYDAPQVDTFNTKNKHSRQTNLYSNMLRDMGFEMNPPKVIMAKFEYPDDSVAVDTDISKIAGDQYIAIFNLDRNESSFDFSNMTSPIKGKAKIEEMREDYKQFRKIEKQVDDYLKGSTGATNQQLEIVQKRFEKLRNKIIQYKNLLDNRDGAISVNLESFANVLEVEMNKTVEELEISTQLAVASEFFNYAKKELDILLKDLNENAADKYTYLKVDDYFGLFEIAEDLYRELEAGKAVHNLKNNEYEIVAKQFEEFRTINNVLRDRIKGSLTEITKKIFTDAYYGSKFEIDHMNATRKAGEALGLEGKELQVYINKVRASPKIRKEIFKKYQLEIETLLGGINYDMHKSTFMMVSDVMTNNDFVQLIHNKLLAAEQKFANTANQEVMELAVLNSELGLSQKEVAELIVKDEEGFNYLVGNVNIKFFNEYKKHTKTIKELNDIETKTYPEEVKKVNKIRAAKKAFDDWKENSQEIVLDPNGPYFRPKKEYRNDLERMFTARQLKALEAFNGIVKKSEKRIQKRSLIANTHLGSARFTRLPGIKQTIFGALMGGDAIAAWKKGYQEATQIEVDDTEEGGAIDPDTGGAVRLVHTGLNDKLRHSVPVQFRARLKENQNKDLFTVFASEIQNGVRYEIDKELSIDAMLIQDMVDSMKFWKTEGASKTLIGSIYRDKNDKETDTIDGDASIVSDMVNKMFKTRVYQLSNEYAGNIPIPRMKKYDKNNKEIPREPTNIDIHRAAQVVSSYTAFASMSFKLLTASNNWLTGNVAVAIEAAGGEFITPKNITRAKYLYASNLGGIMRDIGAPVQTNFINQVMRRLGVQHEASMINAGFERDNTLKKLLDPGFALGGFSMGEHEIHATLSLALLDNIKILNHKGEFLNKKGEITEDRDDAASLLDSYYLDDSNIIQQYEWASTNYNEHEVQSSGEDQGEAAIRGLIKDRVYRTQGAFDKQMASQLDRLWYGKLLKQFKKHIVPQFLTRFRGAANARQPIDKLEMKDKYYNYNAKTEEYGSYVSFFRFAHNVLKQEKFNILSWKKAGSNTWKEMNKHDRANVFKTVAEIGFAVSVLALSSLAAGAAAASDDDEDFLWAMAYLLKRQSGESSLQYIDPREQWRIFESPFAALSHIKHSMNTIEQVFSPTELYVSGVHAGDNKLWSKFKKFTIVGDRAEQFRKAYNKQLFTSIDQNK